MTDASIVACETPAAHVARLVLERPEARMARISVQEAPQLTHIHNPQVAPEAKA